MALPVANDWDINSGNYRFPSAYASANKANRPTMRPEHFALCSDGGGGSGGVAGGRGISWDHPRLKNRSFLPFIEQAFRTYGRTDLRTDGQTDLQMDGRADPLIEMQGRI